MLPILTRGTFGGGAIISGVISDPEHHHSSTTTVITNPFAVARNPFGDNVPSSNIVTQPNEGTGNPFNNVNKGDRISRVEAAMRTTAVQEE